MRLVRYTLKTMRIEGDRLFPLESFERERPLADLVFGELGGSCHWFGLVPPIEVLNQKLKSGGTVVPGPDPNQRQFFYNWAPFEIDRNEYRELVEAARNLPGRPFEYIEPPADVRLLEEWGHWALVRFISLP